MTEESEFNSRQGQEISLHQFQNGPRVYQGSCSVDSGGDISGSEVENDVGNAVHRDQCAWPAGREHRGHVSNRNTACSGLSVEGTVLRFSCFLLPD
jgi:hypothetical protein